MPKFIVVAVLCLSVVPLARPDGEPEKPVLNNGHSKLLRIQEYTHNAADAIKNIVIATPGCKVRLSDMANEVSYRIQSALYGINQGVPSIKNKSLHDCLAETLNGFTELAHDIQHNLHGDSEKLKDVLATSVGKVADLTGKMYQVLKQHESSCDEFITNQIRKSASEIMYAIRKLKHETDFFKKTNKELCGEIDTSLDAFVNALQTLKNDDKKTHLELIHLIQALERIEENAVVKLENFVHINGEEAKNLEIVHEVSKTLSETCDKFDQLTTGKHNVAYIKPKFEELYKSAISLIKKLADIEIAEETVGGQYIRSIIFDSITLSLVYSDEIRRIA